MQEVERIDGASDGPRTLYGIIAPREPPDRESAERPDRAGRRAAALLPRHATRPRGARGRDDADGDAGRRGAGQAGAGATIALVERLYGLLLYAYPPDLRRTHAAEMRQCARAAIAARGAAAVPRLLADLLVTVPREWMQLLKGMSMTGLGRDVAYAIRLLWRSPGFTIAAVLTLALGIGANTAIFTLADATVIRPLRVERPEQLAAFKWSVSLPDYRDWASRTDVFTGVAGVAAVRVNVVVDEGAEPTGCGVGLAELFLRVGAAGPRPRGHGRSAAALTAVIDRDWWRSRS